MMESGYYWISHFMNGEWGEDEIAFFTSDFHNDGSPSHYPWALMGSDEGEEKDRVIVKSAKIER